MKKITKNLTAIVIPMMMIAAACSNSNNNGDNSNNIPEKGISVGSDEKGAKISSSGLMTINDGLTVKDSYFTVDGKRMQNNDVQLGNKITVVFEGIEGLKEENGKVFPQLELVVLDKANNLPVLHNENLLLKSETGYDLKEASVLSGSFTIGNPLQQGHNYKLTINVADKKGSSGMLANISLKVK